MGCRVLLSLWLGAAAGYGPRPNATTRRSVNADYDDIEAYNFYKMSAAAYCRPTTAWDCRPCRESNVTALQLQTFRNSTTDTVGFVGTMCAHPPAPRARPRAGRTLRSPRGTHAHAAARLSAGCTAATSS